MAKGSLIVKVYAGTIAFPVEGAKVRVLGEDVDIILKTDSFGQTKVIELETPDKTYSQTLQHEVRPFSEFTVMVVKEGFVNVTIHGVGIYPEVKAMQDVYLLTSQETSEKEIIINIDPPTLWDPPVRFEDEIAEERVSFVLPIVHDGAKTQPSLAHFNDGVVTTISQWRSKTLGEQGYTAPIYDNYPSSFPGYILRFGACGEPIQRIQNQLHLICGSYPTIPVILNANGVFD